MDWLQDHAWESWLALTIVLGMAEMLSLDFILLMLAAGAGVGILAALLGAPLVLQALFAALSAVAALLLVRPSLIKRIHNGPELNLGHGKLVGQQGVVLETVSGQQVGRIKLAGEVWTASPYDESLVIEPGATVDILQIKGATALVHPVPSIE